MRGKRPIRGEDYCSQLLERLFIPIPGGDYQLTILEQILTIGYSWFHCAAFLTVLSVCVPPKNSGLTDGFLQIFQECVGNLPLFQGSDDQKMLVLVPSSLVNNDTWVLCIVCGQLDGFGQQFWWCFELGCHGQGNLHQCSRPFLAEHFHPHPSAPCCYLCLGKDPGLGNLLGLKAECLPQKSDLRLLMPCNLWLHKHFCFCGLRNSSQSEYSWRRGGRGRKCEECCLKCVTLQPSCGRRGFVTEYFWIELCWVISFINLHKNLMKKIWLWHWNSEARKNKQLFTFIYTVELFSICGAIFKNSLL